MKRAVMIIFSILAIAVISFMIAVPVTNDHAARTVAKELSNTALPTKTDYIESVSRAGKLVGNGNGMQYFGAILIKSELSLEELQAYYSDYADNEWTYIIEKQTDNKIRVIEHGDLKFQTEISGDNFFIIYSWGSNDSILNDLDMRGH